MADDAAEELGPPPERGIVVRALDDGFYVRLHPMPALQGRVVGGIAILFSILGAIVAYAMSEATEVWIWVTLGSAAFGVLLYGLSYGSGFFPVELIGDERCLAWAGDRYMWGQIRACEAHGGTLRLVLPDGRVAAEVKHLDPAVAAWTSRLVTASLD